jgi:hypothetical protein
MMGIFLSGHEHKYGDVRGKGFLRRRGGSDEHARNAFYRTSARRGMALEAFSVIIR